MSMSCLLWLRFRGIITKRQILKIVERVDAHFLRPSEVQLVGFTSRNPQLDRMELADTQLGLSLFEPTLSRPTAPHAPAAAPGSNS